MKSTLKRPMQSLGLQEEQATQSLARLLLMVKEEGCALVVEDNA